MFSFFSVKEKRQITIINSSRFKIQNWFPIVSFLKMTSNNQRFPNILITLVPTRIKLRTSNNMNKCIYHFFHIYDFLVTIIKASCLEASGNFQFDIFYLWFLTFMNWDSEIFKKQRKSPCLVISRVTSVIILLKKLNFNLFSLLLFLLFDCVLYKIFV